MNINALLLSDTHGNFKQVKKILDKAIKDGIKLILHSGDISPHFIYDEKSNYGDYYDRVGQRQYFIKNWLKYAENNIDVEFVICFGNHDFFSEFPPKTATSNFWNHSFNELCNTNPNEIPVGFIPDDVKTHLPKNFHILNGNEVEIYGLKIWGSPFSKNFYSWANNFSEDPQQEQIQADEYWGKIPDYIDIVLSHGPPVGILDTIPNPGRNVGCYHLKKQFDLGNGGRIKNCLLVNVGHIHSAYGFSKVNNTLFVNSALCDQKNKIVNDPFIVHIDTEAKKIIDCKKYQI